MSEDQSDALGAVSEGLDGEAPDHSETQLYLGDDSIEVRISHTVTVAGKDHFIGTNVNFRAMPGEDQYALGERVAGFTLEYNFAIAEQFRSMKLADIAQRKAASNPTK